MINNLKQRLEVQNTVKQLTYSLMQQNNIPAYMMEDALTKILLELKDQSYQQLISELVASSQEEATTSIPKEEIQGGTNGESSSN